MKCGDRGKIITAVRERGKLPEVLTFMRGQFEAGRQAYIVYPLIDESEKLDVKAAAQSSSFGANDCGRFAAIFHGRIPAPEKQAIMEQFRRGETSALISTTVIEVGVDSECDVDVNRERGAFRVPSFINARAHRPRSPQVVLHSFERGEVAGNGCETWRCWKKPAMI